MNETKILYYFSIGSKGQKKKEKHEARKMN